jgi:hypothetical protein
MTFFSIFSLLSPEHANRVLEKVIAESGAESVVESDFEYRSGAMRREIQSLKKQLLASQTRNQQLEVQLAARDESREDRHWSDALETTQRLLDEAQVTIAQVQQDNRRLQSKVKTLNSRLRKTVRKEAGGTPEGFHARARFKIRPVGSNIGNDWAAELGSKITQLEALEGNDDSPSPMRTYIYSRSPAPVNISDGVPKRGAYKRAKIHHPTNAGNHHPRDPGSFQKFDNSAEGFDFQWGRQSALNS